MLTIELKYNNRYPAKAAELAESDSEEDDDGEEDDCRALEGEINSLFYYKLKFISENVSS